MANNAWEAEKARQVSRIQQALAANPDLRTRPEDLSQQAGVPVNRVRRYLAHEAAPVDTVKNVSRRTGVDHRIVRDNAEREGLALTDLQMRHIDDDLVLRLSEEQGLSCRAIARETGYSPGGVSHALRRARAAREAHAVREEQMRAWRDLQALAETRAPTGRVQITGWAHPPSTPGQS